MREEKPRRSHSVLVLPAEGTQPCACGERRVMLFRDGLDALMDNMGCELGLEYVAGPFCPRCQNEALDRARRVDAGPA